jgi:membrane associated rhomboid family serine protease
MDIRLRISEFLRQYQTTGWLIALLVGGVLLQGILYLILAAMDQPALYDQIIEAMVIPPSFQDLIWHPWSLVTYPFFSVEFSLFQLLFNGLILWTFGRVHQQLLGEQRTRRLVILGIPLIGILTWVITASIGFEYKGEAKVPYSQTATPVEAPAQPQADSTLAPQGTVPEADSEAALSEDLPARTQVGRKELAYLSGLTAIIMILVISCITLVPDYPVQLFLFGKVKIVWVGVVLFLLSWGLWALFFTPMGIAIFLGGLLGFGHIYLLRNGTDLTEVVWDFYNEPNRQPRMKVKYGSKPKSNDRKSGRRKPTDANGDEIPQEVIDGILDKISDQGYDSLSREEKELLFKASTRKEDDAD